MARRIHAVARYRSLAAQALGYEVTGPATANLQVKGVRLPRTVVFAHGTTRLDNEWPADRWISLGRQLISQGFQIALPQSSETELALCRRIAMALNDSSEQGEFVDTSTHTEFTSSITSPLPLDQFENDASVVVWPRMSLAHLMDQMAGAAGVVGVDSGLSHLAVALDLPHVQIFSQPRVWRAGPVGQLHQLAVGGDMAPDVPAVWQAWQTVWSARPRPASAQNS